MDAAVSYSFKTTHNNSTFSFLTMTVQAGVSLAHHPTCFHMADVTLRAIKRLSFAYVECKQLHKYLPKLTNSECNISARTRQTMGM